MRLFPALAAAMAAFALASCGSSGENDKEDEPIEQPVTKAPPRTPPKPAADPTAMFRTPADDGLPTDAQLKEGAESSIGTGGVKPVTASPAGPSTTAKPPVPVKPDEDQLDPGE